MHDVQTPHSRAARMPARAGKTNRPGVVIPGGERGRRDRPRLAAVPAWPAAQLNEPRDRVHAVERGCGEPGVALAAAGGYGQAGAPAGCEPDRGGRARVHRRPERRVLRAERGDGREGVESSARHRAACHVPGAGDCLDRHRAARPGHRHEHRLRVGRSLPVCAESRDRRRGVEDRDRPGERARQRVLQLVVADSSWRPHLRRPVIQL
jgi:hypothetical protein